MQQDSDGSPNQPELNIQEIVKKEVTTVLQELIAQSVKEQTKAVLSQIIKTGDYSLTSGKRKPEPVGLDGKREPTDFLLPVKVAKPDGTIEHRRRKRTQQEMKAAITKALPIVKAKHPTWSEKRIRRLATNLVRRYKIS